MTIETIYAAILSAAPAIVSIIGIITALIKMKSAQNKSLDEMKERFETLSTEVKESKEHEELKKQLNVAHRENMELKRKINELLTSIDRIRREKYDK